jgi:parallel beta-helix repeat protein
MLSLLLAAVVAAAVLVVVQVSPVSAGGGDSVVLVDGGGRFDVWVDPVPGSGVGRVVFGDVGDVPLMGDWDCDGVDSPGVFRASTGHVFVRNSVSSGTADRVFAFGVPGDVPLAGDFDGDGCDSVSLYRPSTGRVYVSNALVGGAAEYSFFFGVPGDAAFAGDFDGDGVDTVGVYRASTGRVYFRDSLTAGVAEFDFAFGIPGDRVFVGDWDGDGVDSVAAYRPSNGVVYLKNSHGTGVADSSISVGSYWYATSATNVPASLPVDAPVPAAPPASDPAPTQPATPATGGVYVPDVHVYPGDGLAAMADGWPEGTVFMVHGVHVGEEVTPRDGQVFVGASDAVLDGGGWAEFAFSGVADDVVISGLEIVDYATPAQYGSVYVSGSGWLVEDNEIHGSGGAGVSVRDDQGPAVGNVFRNNRIHHNHQLGVAVTGSVGTVLDGNEIAYNNWLGEYNWGWEAGASKFWETQNLVVRGNWSHHNTGPGLWADTDNVGTVYENNVVEDNEGPGIFHEVSGSAVIRNNVIRRNGFDWQAWLWGAGILIAASDSVEIYGNRLEGNYNGISLVEQDRENGHVVAGVHVSNNTLVDTGLSGAVTDTGDDSIFYADNWFQSNAYHGNVGWAWDGSTSIGWDAWRSTGNDTNGTYQP